MGDDAERVEKTKAYLAKYDIEKVLAEAVNHAIKAETSDPFGVIGKYLMELSTVSATALFPCICPPAARRSFLPRCRRKFARASRRRPTIATTMSWRRATSP